MCEKPLEHVTCVRVCFSRVADTLDMFRMIPFPRMRVTDELQVVADTAQGSAARRAMQTASVQQLSSRLRHGRRIEV